MADQIRITSIGSPGSGKTCFLYSLYAQMAFGVRGFTFMPADYDQALDLEAGWKKIIQQGRWPDNTDLTNTYLFECSYSYKPIFAFDWCDYRGAIWQEKDSVERRELLNKLDGSEALFIFINAETINGILRNDLAAEIDLRNIAQLIKRYRASHDPIPVALIITKADLLPSKNIENAILKLKGDSEEQQGYLASLFYEEGNWPVMITAVSLGSNLGGLPGQEIQGSIAPHNIHLPVMFAIHNRLSRLLSDEVAEIEFYESAKNSAHEQHIKEINKSGWKKFWRGDNSETSQQMLKEAENRLRAQHDIVGKLKKEMLKIEEELNEGCVIYLSGDRVRYRV